jgi:hypothetical protein
MTTATTTTTAAAAATTTYRRRRRRRRHHHHHRHDHSAALTSASLHPLSSQSVSPPSSRLEELRATCTVLSDGTRYTYFTMRANAR